MSWHLFAVIQVAVFARGAAAAFQMRNRQLKRRLRDIEAESGEASAFYAEKWQGLREASHRAPRPTSSKLTLAATR